MGKTVKYLILDTETATLPFANEWNLTPDQKKKIAIAKPLVYDIGWAIATRSGGILETKQFLVAETFAVPSIFNTAYYKEKRPLYLKDLQEKKTTVLPWNDIVEILMKDLHTVSYVTAYNAMFDYVKAIPYTDLYIKHLYAPNYQDWEAQQKDICKAILTKSLPDAKRDFDKNNFYFRGEKFPMIDIWGLACSNITNTNVYKRQCLEKGYLSNTGLYFSSNAENAKRYIEQKFDFVEDHTALSDAIIETHILFKALKNGKKIEGIIYFPFRLLGETIEFALTDKKITKGMANTILEKMGEYVEQSKAQHPDKTEPTQYENRILEKIEIIRNFMEEKGWG